MFCSAFFHSLLFFVFFSILFVCFFILVASPYSFTIKQHGFSAFSQLSLRNILLDLMQLIKLWHLLVLLTKSTQSKAFLGSPFASTNYKTTSSQCSKSESQDVSLLVQHRHQKWPMGSLFKHQMRAYLMHIVFALSAFLYISNITKQVSTVV